MFEQLFEGTQTLARQRAGPLLEERLRYLNHLAKVRQINGCFSTGADSR